MTVITGPGEGATRPRSVAKGRRGQLPEDLTTFVGRRQAFAELRALLSDSRLVTLTGISGVGKSRLAKHVARSLRRAYPDGVHLVELASLREPALLAHHVGTALDLRDLGASAEEVVCRHLNARRLLLVLDNCEHLLESCGAFVAQLLRFAPSVSILATSIEPLRVAGEQPWQVPPLDLPRSASRNHVATANVADDGSVPSASAGYDAIMLFADRAATVVPGFEVTDANRESVTRVCSQLEGIPLALELAASRLSILSLEQISDRLDDRYGLLSSGPRNVPPRHRTLGAAVEWTHELCSSEEQLLWARLGVFAGEMDYDAIEAVCAADDLPVEALLAAVAGLADKSILVRRERAKRVYYGMLETLRQFGLDRLRASGAEDSTRRRHRDHYLALAEQAEDEWFGPQQIGWALRLQAQQANLWQALNFCLTSQAEISAGLQMGGALSSYWNFAGAVGGGRHWLRRVLESQAEPSPQRNRALWVAAYLAIRDGDAPDAMALLDECLRHAQELNDETAMARATQLLGQAWQLANEPVRAVPLLERALVMERSLKTPGGHVVTALFRLALAKCTIGQLDEAQELCEEGIALCVRNGDVWGRSWILWVMAVIAWSAQDSASAIECVRESLDVDSAARDPLNVAVCTELLAWTEARDHPEVAAQLLGLSHALWKPFGSYLFGYKGQLAWHDECVRRSTSVLGCNAYAMHFKKGAESGDVASWRSLLAAHLVSASESRAATRSMAATGAGSGRKGGRHALTKRELEVAGLLAEGLTNREIAERLVVSRRTADSHVEHIFAKLGISSRARIAPFLHELAP